MKLTLKALIAIAVTVVIAFCSFQKTPVDYSKDINDLKVLVTELQHRSDSLAGALGNTNSNLSNLSKSVDSIKLKLTDIQTQIDALTLSLTTTNANIATINAQLILLNQQYALLLEQLNAILAQLNAAPSTLFDGLIAYYPLRGNSKDSTANGNNLITVGSLTYVTSYDSSLNSACNFDNGNNYFLLPSSSWALINNLPTGTVSFWLKINSQYVSGHYFGIGNSFMTKVRAGGEDLFFGMQDGTTKIRMQLSGVFPANPGTDVIGNTSLQIGKWYHIVGAWDGVNQTIFINGVKDGQISNSGGISNYPSPLNLNGDFFAIGTSIYGSNAINPTGTYGSMSDVRFYNRALNQSEITYLASH